MRSSIRVVGSNKRYADSLQRRRRYRDAENQVLVPKSLNEAERGTDIRRGTTVPVQAWVTVGDTPVQILGNAVEWTSRAVLVIWAGADGSSRRAWVWASAVDRVDP